MKRYLLAAALLVGSLTSTTLLAQERWLVLGGDIAETLAALEADNALVARDDTSLYPDSIVALPSVGYLRQLSAESVLGLHPDRILASSAAGPAEALEQIEAVGVEITQIDVPPTLAAIPDKVRRVAAETDREAEGEALAQRLEGELAALDTLPPRHDLRVMFILHHSGLTPRAAGRQTGADEALDAIGVTNAFGDMQGYQSIGAEALVQQAPDVVVMSQRGLDALGGEDALWTLPGMALTPAGERGHLILVDDQALLGFGPRTPDELSRLRQAIDALDPP